MAREGLLVPEDSDIESIADLSGRTVAYSPGSSANYFAVQALETEGLTLDDVESVPLQPADARAAFQGSSLDAWATWDPFLIAAVQELGARPLDPTFATGAARGRPRAAWLSPRSPVARRRSSSCYAGSTPCS